MKKNFRGETKTKQTCLFFISIVADSPHHASSDLTDLDDLIAPTLDDLDFAPRPCVAPATSRPCVAQDASGSYVAQATSGPCVAPDTSWPCVTQDASGSKPKISAELQQHSDVIANQPLVTTGGPPGITGGPPGITGGPPGITGGPRAAASGLSVLDVLSPLVAVPANNDHEHQSSGDGSFDQGLRPTDSYGSLDEGSRPIGGCGLLDQGPTVGYGSLDDGPGPTGGNGSPQKGPAGGSMDADDSSASFHRLMVSIWCG